MRFFSVWFLLFILYSQLSASTPVNADAISGEILLEPGEKGLLDAFMVLSKASIIEGNLKENIISLHRPLPIYPAGLLSLGVIGKAVLRFVIDEDGVVKDIVLERDTHDEFGKAAVEAVRVWRFAPPKSPKQSPRLQIRVTFVYSQYYEAFDAKSGIPGFKEQVVR